jgi:hypothetical protein
VEVRVSVPGDYAHPDAETTSNDVVMYLHGIGDVVTAAAEAGADLPVEYALRAGRSTSR